MFHTPAHKVAPHLPQAGTIENRPFANDPRLVEERADDVVVTGHGSIYLVSPQTVEGNAWCERFISTALRFGTAYAVEHRFIADVVDGMINSDLKVA